MKTSHFATGFLFLLLSSNAWALSITSITPNTGPTTGGAVNIIIRADANWPAVTSVAFGAFGNATVASTSGPKITLSAIPAATGPGSVTVTITAGGNPYTTTFTYVNAQLQVNVNSTVNSVIDICWGGTTVADSSGSARANTIAAYNWVAGSTSVADAATASVSLASSYKLSDDYKVTILNKGTGTGSTVQFTATCTNSAAWTNNGAGGPAANKFQMQGRIGLAGALLTITTAASGPFANTIASGVETQIDLIYFTPTSITSGADTQQTMTVTFTGSHT